MEKLWNAPFVLFLRTDGQAKAQRAHSDTAVFGFFQLRVNLQVWPAEWFFSIDEDNYKD